MKIKLQDVLPNPFRDMDRYPVNQSKIDQLTRSIESTGFWDNVVARQVGNKVEVAYGHHRLSALKAMYDPDVEFDWIVRDLDDEKMLRMMADENLQEWEHSSAIVRETVRAVVLAAASGTIYLQPPAKDTGENKIRYAPSFSYGKRPSSSLEERPYTSDSIAIFLGQTGKSSLNTTGIRYALRALSLIENGHVLEKEFAGLSAYKCRPLIEEAEKAVVRSESITRAAKRAIDIDTTPAQKKHIEKTANEQVKRVVRSTAKAVSGALKADGGTVQSAKIAAAEVRAEHTGGEEVPDINRAAISVAKSLRDFLDPEKAMGAKLEQLKKFKNHISGEANRDIVYSINDLIDAAQAYLRAFDK